MGFLKNLQRKIEAKTDEIKSRSAPETVKSSFDMDEAYYNFEDRYGNTCDRKEEKIYNVETDSRDPDKNVKGFQKMLELCHDLEEFCASKGSGGIAYFKTFFQFIVTLF